MRGVRDLEREPRRRFQFNRRIRVESNPPPRFYHIACGASLSRRKVLGRNAVVLVGICTSGQDKYGNSETRLKNASIRGTDPWENYEPSGSDFLRHPLPDLRQPRKGHSNREEPNYRRNFTPPLWKRRCGRRQRVAAWMANRILVIISPGA